MRRKGAFVLKATQDSSDEESIENSGKDEKELAILIKRFKKFLIKLNESKKSGSKKAKEVICFKCKRPDHI